MIAGDFNIHSQIWDIYHKNDKITKSEKQLIKFITDNNLNIMNNSNKPTHCKFDKIDDIATITEYNTIDLTLVSPDLDELLVNWDTNSFNVSNNDELYNNELDSKWVTEVFSTLLLLLTSIPNQHQHQQLKHGV